MFTKDEASVEGIGARHATQSESLVEPIQVLLVEDNENCAAAFRQSLDPYDIDTSIATSAASARQFLIQLGVRFDAVLLDLPLPDGRGENLLSDIEALSKQPGIVILSDFLGEISPEATSYRAVIAPKTIAPSCLASILRHTANGYAECILKRFAKHFSLTPGEMKVLDHVATGSSPKETAAAIGCSTQAVYAHLKGIGVKTSCGCYQEVVAKLFQFSCHGLGRGICLDHDTRVPRSLDSRIAPTASNRAASPSNIQAGAAGTATVGGVGLTTKSRLTGAAAR